MPRYYTNYYYEYEITAIVLVALLAAGVIGLISYILKGFGMYTIAKRQGMSNPWLAFVPFARNYLQGELSGDITLKKRAIKKPGLWLLILPIAGGVVSSIIFGFVFVMIAAMGNYASYGYWGGAQNIMGLLIGVFLLIGISAVIAIIQSAVISVLKALVNVKILERFTTRNMAILHSVLCFMIPLYESICFFVMRNKPYMPGMEPPVQPPYTAVPPEFSYMPAGSDFAGTQSMPHHHMPTGENPMPPQQMRTGERPMPPQQMRTGESPMPPQTDTMINPGDGSEW